MGKFKKPIRNYEVQFMVEQGLKTFMIKSFHESKPTKEKPYGIEATDWHQKFVAFPYKDYFENIIPKYRKFRHYKTSKARDRALEDLEAYSKKHYLGIKFRVPPNEKNYILPQFTENKPKGFIAYIKHFFTRTREI